MYQGASALSMDAKGRMSIPARHRDALSLQSEGRVTLTRHPHGCLLLFPRPVWEQHREQIANWPMSARAWQRIFLGNLAQTGGCINALDVGDAPNDWVVRLMNYSPPSVLQHESRGTTMEALFHQYRKARGL